MTLYAARSPRVPDGTFSYRQVQPYGPAVPTTVTVHDGCLFAFVVGELGDAQAAPADVLLEIQALVFEELAWHLEHGLATRQEESVAA